MHDVTFMLASSLFSFAPKNAPYIYGVRGDGDLKNTDNDDLLAEGGRASDPIQNSRSIGFQDFLEKFSTAFNL